MWEHSRGGGLADEVGDLLGELVGAAHHHAVQRGRVLRDVDADGAHLHHGRVVGFQPPLGAVQSLRFGNAALHHGPDSKREQQSFACPASWRLNCF